MTFLRSLYLTLMALAAFGCATPLRRPCEFTIKVKVLTDMNADFECRRMGLRRHDNGDFIKDMTVIKGCAAEGLLITNGDEWVGGHELNHEVERYCK